MPQNPKPEHPHNRKKRHPNWGGRRFGAGARPGNMNALSLETEPATAPIFRVRTPLTR
jgi:hypothetical protein